VEHSFKLKQKTMLQEKKEFENAAPTGLSYEYSN
jgi:hypothetical protein